ncbi:MAG: type II toxin-antitoxin system RelE/ParE family toxin [Mailhella sp.]|nr:type II toxin-antitoxin system RelE/ParE family toxin [Mailhella sp.]
MNLRFTSQAHADLLEIRRYVSSKLHNETAAQRIARAILASCSNLKCFPQGTFRGIPSARFSPASPQRVGTFMRQFSTFRKPYARRRMSFFSTGFSS